MRGRWVKLDERIFTLDVFILSGCLTKKFVKKNPVISRTIEIRGDQTLDDLHWTIFEAFNRHDEHMYEFQFGGKGPMDRKARRYVLPEAIDDEPKPAGCTEYATIGSLNLKADDAFGYWFDFGDDWWHQINVKSIQEKANPRAKYPKIVGRVGKSPPQYLDPEEED
jgi:hypothetical protein